MGNIEQIINQKLNKYPIIKKSIKRIYQMSMWLCSKKIKSYGDIYRISPNDSENEYFFGYYDKSPWDISDRYVLCLKAKNTWKCVAPKEKAQILIIDTQNNNKVTIIGETNSWNVQQGCMLQWLGPKFNEKIIYNDFRNGEFCSIIVELFINDKEISVVNERVIPKPVYSVSKDGSFALSLDFSRLHRLRPGYGYSNTQDDTSNEALPDKTCIWYIDLNNCNLKEILRYKDFSEFESREEMQDAVHKVNHIMINDAGDRFMVLHRWIKGTKKYTRLITCDIDGKNMYNLLDDNMVSHCCWKSNSEILAFANKKNMGMGYYLLEDKSKKYLKYWNEINYDGHPSYSMDGKNIVFDRYPDRKRIAAIMLSQENNIDANNVKIIAKVFAPFKYDNDTRCDLHPRWNHSGSKICFDSVFEGSRGLYIANLERNE